MLLDVLLIILVVCCIGGLGWGWGGGTLAPASPLTWLLVLVAIVLLISLIGPHFLWAPYPVAPR